MTKSDEKLKWIETPYGYSYAEYKGLTIDRGLYGNNGYTVNYCGDDIYCETLEEAKKTVDEIIAYDKIS